MIERGFEIVDRIIQLLQYRGQWKKDIITNHIDPIFLSMEQIHSDYLTATEKLKKELSGMQDIDYIVSCLRQRKAKLEALRVKTDSYVKAARSKRKYPDCARSFFDSCIRYFESQSRETYDSYYGHYSRLIESVLSKKEKLEGHTVGGEYLSDIQMEMSYHLERFQHYVRKGWQDVADAYGKCRISLT